ncbi:MAG: M1 family aminopeptidase, partial [Aquaticitalea sp.]
TQAQIGGKVTTYFEAKSPMNQITFDLANNMTVYQVMQRGASLAYTQNSNEELVITLPTTQNTGILDSLTVTYSGNPVSSGFGSFEVNTHLGKPILWTLSEPYGAKAWWPCKQDLNDKVDAIDVYVTSPRLNPDGDEYVAVSNGLELGQVVNGPNKTTHYRHQYPIPAYLIAIAVTNYSVYSHEVPNNGNPFPIVNYVYPENLVSAQTKTPITVDIINLYTSLFGEYPFANEKYGHAQFGWGGGMEHTTVSFMGGLSRGLIAHELGHQWFGDKVTCGSWKDIWLNEGFATYLAGLTIENLDGEVAFNNWKQQTINSVTVGTSGAVYLTDTDTLNVNRIFSGRLSYDKGAMMIHMLRKKLGDAVFFQGCQNYLNDPSHAYGYAKSEDFISIMETASGQDLSEFFNDWLYNQGYPSYGVEWNQPNANEIKIRISQTQSDPSVSFFEVPVPLRIVGTQGEIMEVVLNNTTNQEIFTKSVNFTVTEVIYDPNHDIISRDNTVELNVNEAEFNQPFLMFPNPVSQTLHIQKPEAMQISEVRFYNALGQLMSQRTFYPIMDVSNLSTGMLFVQFQTNTGTITKSLLKN